LAFESPDGASLYFAKQSPNGGAPGIWRMPLSGGEEKLVLETVGFGHWTLTERGIYFVSGEARSGWPIEL
jgi:Tol biopolymer transport system component